MNLELAETVLVILVIFKQRRNRALEMLTVVYEEIWMVWVLIRIYFPVFFRGYYCWFNGRIILALRIKSSMVSATTIRRASVKFVG